MTAGLQTQQNGLRMDELLTGMVTLPEQHDVAIYGLALDSREVTKGDAFIALAGAKQHGLTHVQQAVDNGACAVIFDPAGEGRQLADTFRHTGSVPLVAVDNLGRKLGDLAARFYR